MISGRFSGWRGEGGFGYAPVFLPAPHGTAGLDPANVTRMPAEYGEDEKNEISHRGRAILA